MNCQAGSLIGTDDYGTVIWPDRAIVTDLGSHDTPSWHRPRQRQQRNTLDLRNQLQ